MLKMQILVHKMWFNIKGTQYFMYFVFVWRTVFFVDNNALLNSSLKLTKDNEN